MIPARREAVGATELCTVIAEPTGASVSTIEHLMAALTGMGVDNCLVEIDGPEVPIMDGSSALFVDAIDQVGVDELASNRRVIKVLKPVRFSHGNSWAELAPRASGFGLDVEIDFPTPLIGRQRRVLDLTPASFRADISRARTFGFMKDVEFLWKRNLALGASLENTVALGDDRVINPEGLRYPVRPPQDPRRHRRSGTGRLRPAGDVQGLLPWPQDQRDDAAASLRRQIRLCRRRIAAAAP
jgi:UDP-3-O-[3-hydroxymyristoyl] N-acetylglucosamine deacetylase